MRAVSLPDLYDLMFRDFDKFFSNLSNNDFYGDFNYPPMNLWIEKESKDLVLGFAVAGIPMENIKVDVEGDYLLLEIDKSHDELVGPNYTLLKRGIRNSHSKSKVYIPSSKYQVDKIKAELKDGLLLISVPTREESKPKRIQIEFSDGKKKLEEKPN